MGIDRLHGVLRRSRVAHQHELAFRSWGGARRGAGRKPTGPRARVSHDMRPALSSRHPVHVTIRLRAGLPSLRQERARVAVARAFAAGNDRFGFRLSQFSLQSNHLHLIAEADDRRALSRGMQALLVRVARALNRLWRRCGSVFSDRFHARALRTPREVRSALLYVLQNARHHGLRLAGIDPYSSGPWFDGWNVRRAVPPPTSRNGDRPRIDGILAPTMDTREPGFGHPVVPARTWLMKVGWRRHGFIDVDETPRLAQVRSLH